MSWRAATLITSVIGTLLNKEMCSQSANLNGIIQSRLWRGRHQHHDYEDNITIVLTILKIAQPYTTSREPAQPSITAPALVLHSIIIILY